MNVLVYFLAALVCFALAYRFYGRFIARSVGLTRGRPTPAVELNDSKDFVPTRPSILFAHHYSTIAGAGPIVGPTLGILYGIGPVWLQKAGRKSWYTMVPAVVMVVTTIASLIYYLFVKYLPTGNFFLAATDLLLLALAFGVVWISVKRLIARRPERIESVSL